ncbi:MAG: TetR family transcriptional regulator [Oscillochloris sp.]|nr:TetR family transcriptional regulator [Oscillochloris sp.]
MARSVGIDKAQVIAAAAELADSNGLEALTLAQVAAKLGIKLPSLYNHVDGLAGLRRALALLGLRELADLMSRAAIGKAEADALMAIAVAYRDYVKQHPGCYAAGVRAPAADDPELVAAGTRVVEIVAAVLAPYELSDDDVIHAIRALRAIVHGFATLETAGGFGIPLDQDVSFRRLMQIYIQGVRRTV